MFEDDEDDEEEISPWEAAQQKEEEDIRHVYHHLKVGPANFLKLAGAVALGVFVGLWVFSKFYPSVGP